MRECKGEILILLDAIAANAVSTCPDGGEHVTTAGKKPPIISRTYAPCVYKDTAKTLYTNSNMEGQEYLGRIIGTYNGGIAGIDRHDR